MQTYGTKELAEKYGYTPQALQSIARQWGVRKDKSGQYLWRQSHIDRLDKRVKKTSKMIGNRKLNRDLKVLRELPETTNEALVNGTLYQKVKIKCPSEICQSQDIIGIKTIENRPYCYNCLRFADNGESRHPSQFNSTEVVEKVFVDPIFIGDPFSLEERSKMFESFASAEDSYNSYKTDLGIKPTLLSRIKSWLGIK